jgi:NADP-dependent alcohol dehydrogenase
MLDFDFCNPTRIIFGRGRIAEIDYHVPQTARVLVLLGGGSVKRNGTLGEVMAAQGSRYVCQFEGIEPNPTYETLITAMDLVRQEQLDYLLAVGGGSVLDGTKFVAAGVLSQDDPGDILLTSGANVQAALPIGIVLTLPATGSEMNTNAVISRKEHGAKLSFSSMRSGSGTSPRVATTIGSIQPSSARAPSSRVWE